MARRDLNLDDEKRSYAGLWLLGATLLVLGAIWAILDDSFLRRPWKQYQHGFYDIEHEREHAKLEAEEKKLNDDPKYVELRKQLDAAKESQASGETASKLADAEKRIAVAKLDEGEADLNVRFVKSELEAAWYQYDHALETGGNVSAAQKQRDELIAQKGEREKEWQTTLDAVARIQAEMDELQAPVKTLEKQLEEHEAERALIQNRLDGMKSIVANVEMDRIATIQQIVLPDFDTNNFEQPVDRVDRCTSCHVGIDKSGFEDVAQPWTTHPKRDPLLTKHPPDQFGCTPCHDGQGVALNSIKQAHGDVRFWLQPLLQGDQMQSRCLDCHRDVSTIGDAPSLAKGEYLFEQLGCHGCHLVSDYDGLGDVGPSLRRISAKVDPQWMVGWIHDPYAFRPRTKMPNFEFSDAQAKAAAAYLWTSSKEDGAGWLASHPDPGGIDPADAAQVAKGKELFDEVGCRACHAAVEGEVATPVGANKDYAPNLARIGEKTTGQFIYWWIKDPRGYNPESRMPSLRLTDDEARAITAYLLSLSSAAPAAEQTITSADLESPELAKEGEAVVRKYGCYGCHSINGMDAESRIGVELSSFATKPLEELYFGNHPEIPRNWNAWTFHKLQDPRIYATEHVEQLMPNFHLADEDIENLRVWLQSRRGYQPPLRYRADGYDGRQERIQKGRRIVERYNCMGCHQIDGRGGYIRTLYQDNPTSAPPILNGEGAKVQPEWFFGFLQDPARQPLRFWLDIRMPTFGLEDHETTAIVDYFTALAELEDPYFYWDPKIDSNPELLQVGEMLMSDDYFSCWSCHVRGNETPGGPMEQWAPNLAYAHERLNPVWILSWIKDPQAMMPGTKMPAFYPGGPPDVLGGDESKQIVAMRDYIMSLGNAAGVAVAAEAPAPADAAPVDPTAPRPPAEAKAPGADDRRAAASGAAGS